MWVIGLAVLVVALGISAGWAAHRFRVATRDSLDLAAKVHVPRPQRASDWPELRVDAVVIDPEAGNHVLVFVHWPAHPERQALLTIEVVAPGSAACRLLHQWRDVGASVSPRADVDELVLRRRHTNDVVRARVVREAYAAT
jgi:hypothetical protein